MFVYAFFHNGFLNEVREGNVQIINLQICGKILLKVLKLFEVECILLYATVPVMLNNLTKLGAMSLLIVFNLCVCDPTELCLKGKINEVSSGIAL